MNYRAWIGGAILLAILGCSHPQTRSQAPDETEKDSDIKTIGDITTVANADPIPVSGVGLVVHLEGTGGDSPSGTYRNFLEHELHQQGIDHVREVLASADNAMVMVSALIPAGAHKGDPIDIEITLPPQSRVTSLRGGFLQTCFLYNYDTTKNLNPQFNGANIPIVGHRLVKAEGPLLVGFGDGDPAAKLRHAYIWGGGVSKIERPFYLVLNDKEQRAPMVERITERINSTFEGAFRNGQNDVASANTKTFVYLRVPQQYRLNLQRYLRIVRLIPLQDQAGQTAYRHRLEQELLDPAHTVTAALRLESLGNECVPALKLGLQSQHPLVRFTSAEALAYLGCPTCGEALSELVEHQPLVRAFSLTAMASLDEAVCHVKLRDLLGAPAPETRYGAFRALRALDEHDPAVQGEFLNNSFWIHRVAPDSSPLVHMSTSRRAEIVIFGKDPYLVPPFSFLAGEFTFTAAVNDPHCTLSRLSVRHGTRRRQCSLKVEEVLHNMADMGGMYPEGMELLRQAGTYQCMTCPIAIDALPQATSVYELANNGANQAEPLPFEKEFLNAREDLGAVPTLYDKTSVKRGPRSIHDAENEEAPHGGSEATKVKAPG